MCVCSIPFFFFSSYNSYLEEVFKVWLVVGFTLQQGGGIELAGAEADVGLHVSEF